MSNLGDGIFLVALPLLTAELTRDPTAVAGVAVAQGLPWLAFSLVAGALVDRLDRRRVMWITDVARAALVAALAVAVVLDAHSVPLLYVVAFGLGLAETLFDNASQAILPALVPGSRLEAANGRLFTAQTLTNDFVGKPVGGLLFAAGASLPFWADAATFVVAALLIALVPGRYRSMRTGPPRSLRSDIAEGVGWLFRHPVLRTLAALLGVVNLAATASTATFVLFAQELLGVDGAGFGVLLATFAVGALLGGLVAERVTRRLGTSATILGAGVGFGVISLAIAPLSSAVAVGVLTAVMGLLVVLWNVVTVSLRQAIIPDELLGRVNSVYRFLGWGAIPIGGLVGGVVAGVWGLRAPWWFAGALTLVAVAVAAPQLTPSRIAAARAAAPART